MSDSNEKTVTKVKHEYKVCCFIRYLVLVLLILKPIFFIFIARKCFGFLIKITDGGSLNVFFSCRNIEDIFVFVSFVLSVTAIFITSIIFILKDDSCISLAKLNELNSLRQSFISNPIEQKVNTKTYVKDTNGDIIREEINENNYVELLKKYMDTLVEI